MGYTSLSHGSIVAGSVIDLAAIDVTFDFNNFTATPSIPGKDMSTSWNARLHEVDFVGHADPTYIITGRFNMGSRSVTLTNSAGSVVINPQMMGSFATLGSPVVFRDDRFILNPAGSTMVVVESFKCTRDVSSAGSNMDDSPQNVKYSMKLVETKVW